MKKLALVLALVLALPLCLGAFSVSAAEDLPIFYGFAMDGDRVGTGTLSRDVIYQPNGYRTVTTVGTGNSASDSINDDGTIAFGSNTNWNQTSNYEQTSANGSWWAAPVALYDTAVTANQVFIPIIGGDGAWSGNPYVGDFSTHKVLYADSYDGVWTEVEFEAVSLAHDGSYMQGDWGYGSILVYSFEEVTAKCFMISFGEENVMFQRLMAINTPVADEAPEAPEAPSSYTFYNSSNYLGTIADPTMIDDTKGYLPVDAVGSGNSANDAQDNGVFTWGNVNWGNAGGGNGTAQGTWWFAPVATYTTAVTANQIIVNYVNGQGNGWEVNPYVGDFSQHKVWYTDDVNGTWTELEFSAETIVHDGTYIQADWGYGGIFVYSFEAVTAKYFMVTYGEDQVLACRAYAAYAPEASEETQAPETQAPETQAPATQAPETQAPETEGDNADTADFAIASLALAAVAAAGVVLTKKRK